MEPDTTPTRVIFRKFPKKDGGDVIALMPELPGTNNFYMTCQSYQHIGQHGSASVLIMTFADPATPEEYADLKAELESLGYLVKVAHRFTESDFEKRRAAVQRVK